MSDLQVGAGIIISQIPLWLLAWNLMMLHLGPWDDEPPKPTSKRKRHHTHVTPAVKREVI